MIWVIDSTQMMFHGGRWIPPGADSESDRVEIWPLQRSLLRDSSRVSQGELPSLTAQRAALFKSYK